MGQYPSSFLYASLLYALMWLVFGVVHSLLASDAVKQRFRPLLGQRYRLTYNIFATVHTLAVLGFGHWVFSSVSPWSTPGWFKGFLLLLFFLGLLIGVMALRAYDLGVFSGLSQRDIHSEPLSTEGLHRWVRHPLYSALFLMLWSLVATPFGACTAVFGSIYLVLGTRSEERKLVQQYGDKYRLYRESVPAFFPRFGR